MTDNIDANPNKARESQARQVGIERADKKRRKKQEKRGDGSGTKAGGIITTGAVELVAAHMQSLLDAEAAKSKNYWKAWYHHLRWLPLLKS